MISAGRAGMENRMERVGHRKPRQRAVKWISHSSRAEMEPTKEAMQCLTSFLCREMLFPNWLLLTRCLWKNDFLGDEHTHLPLFLVRSLWSLHCGYGQMLQLSSQFMLSYEFQSLVLGLLTASQSIMLLSVGCCKTELHKCTLSIC